MVAMNRLAFVPLVLAGAAHAAPQPVLTPEAAAVIGDGRLLSFHTEDARSEPDYTLHIVKLSKSGPTVLSSTLISYDGTETWIDARTLAVVSVDTKKKSYTLQYFVDGVVDPTRTLTRDLAWNLPKGAPVPTTTWGYRSTKGALYLRSCLPGKGGTECPTVWTRIDGAAPGPVKAPAGVVPFSAPHAKDPVVKAPKDPVVKLTKIASAAQPKKKIPAIACTKSGVTVTWSYESMVDSGEVFLPASTRWVMLDPPIYAATGRHSDPAGYASTATYYFRACEPREMDSFVWLGGGLWMEDDGSTLQVHAGKDPVAVFAGSTLKIAPVAQPPASGDKR
jgi:hypothetical protein